MSSVTGTGNFRGRADLRLVVRQIGYEQLSFWLNPVAAVFTVGFSVVFLVLLGAAAGNARIPALHNIRQIQYYVPGFAAYGVMSACFNMLAVTLVVRREMGLLKRMRLSPLPTWVMLAAIFGNALIISFVQVVALLAIGKFGYHVILPHNFAAVAVVLLVGAICFTSLGIAASTLIPNQEAGGPVIGIVFFALLFLSGLWYPLNKGSGLAQFSSYFPVRHMITGVFTPFNGQRGVSDWPWSDMLTMAIWAVAGVLVSLRRWSWAPRRGDAGRRRGPPGRTPVTRRAVTPSG